MAGIANKVTEINYAQLMSAGTISAFHQAKALLPTGLTATLKKLHAQMAAQSAKVDKIIANRGRQR